MSTQIQQVSAIPPLLVSQDIDIGHFTISTTERVKLLESYKVMLGRMMMQNFKAFKWLETILPRHIPHPYSDTAQKKSTIIPLQIILKNEAKYEDCVTILEESVDMIQALYHGAGISKDTGSVPFYGDQLTHVRLQGAKTLRGLSPTRRGRFDDVGPFLCTLWHMKQDFVHKAYKQLWKGGTTRDQGTLNYLKTILRLSDVNGNVKSNYEAHA
ncbi:uncharacterized protein [Ptychodera flava]|uniref:uncharacterized protein n=1 Tax=Ptychodera flava TaxID=63121 RepID=UPI003969BD2B